MKSTRHIVFIIIITGLISCFPVIQKAKIPPSIDPYVAEKIMGEPEVMIIPMWRIYPIVVTDGAGSENILKQPIFTRGSRANSLYKKMKTPSNFGIVSPSVVVGRQASLTGIFIFTLKGTVYWLQNNMRGEYPEFYLVKKSYLSPIWLDELLSKLNIGQPFHTNASIDTTIWGAFDWGRPRYQCGSSFSKSETNSIEQFLSRVKLSGESSWATIKNNF